MLEKVLKRQENVLIHKGFGYVNREGHRVGGGLVILTDC